MKTPLLFAILLSSLLLGTSCKDKAQKTEALNELEEAHLALQKKQAEELETTGGISHNPESLDNVIEAAKKLETNSTGDEAKVAKIMRVFMQDIQADSTSLVEAQKGLTAAMDYSNVKSAADIDALSGGVKKYQQLNTELTTKVKSGWLSELQQNLEKEGVGAKIKDGTIKGFNSQMSSQKPHLLTIRQTDNDLCLTILKQHELLKKYFGKWTWDTATSALNFEDGTALKLFNEQSTKLQEISQKQLEAQKKLLQAN